MTPLEAEYSRRWAPYYDPDAPMDGTLVAGMVWDAIAGHRFERDRLVLLEAVDDGEVVVWGPDERGWRIITVGGNPIVTAHWTQFCTRETLEALSGWELPDWEPPTLKRIE